MAERKPTIAILQTDSDTADTMRFVSEEQGYPVITVPYVERLDLVEEAYAQALANPEITLVIFNKGENSHRVDMMRRIQRQYADISPTRRYVVNTGSIGVEIEGMEVFPTPFDLDAFEALLTQAPAPPLRPQ